MARHQTRSHRTQATPIRIEANAVDSTNAWARRLLRLSRESGYDLPTLDLVACEQQDGRGRRGRHWLSPAGTGLYASQIREVSAEALGRLPLLASVALAEALREWRDVRLKWPNDLLIGGKKVGGILIECVGGEGGNSMAIIGFGLNLKDPEEGQPQLPDTATSLERLVEADATGVVSSPHGDPIPASGALLDTCLSAVDEMIAAPITVKALLDRYQSLSVHERGETLRCETGSGVSEGTFAGFTSQGWLLLETTKGRKRISTGEILE